MQKRSAHVLCFPNKSELLSMSDFTYKEPQDLKTTTCLENKCICKLCQAIIPRSEPQTCFVQSTFTLISGKTNKTKNFFFHMCATFLV